MVEERRAKGLWAFVDKVVGVDKVGIDFFMSRDKHLSLITRNTRILLRKAIKISSMLLIEMSV